MSLSWVLGMTSPFCRDSVEEASFGPDVDPSACAGANLPQADGMVIEARQPMVIERQKVESLDDVDA